MKRLRHPVRAIEEPFGKAGLIVAVIALVLALTGAAFAAAGLSGKQKKEVEKIAKKYAGKPGAQGAAGTNGSNGTNGKNGGNGSNGVNAEATSFTGSKTVGSVTCTEGGLVVKSASGESLVCNGKKGTNGTPGQPWSPNSELPSGATETGFWRAEGSGAQAVISIPVKLAQKLEFTADCEHNPVGPTCPVHYINKEGKEVNGQEQEVTASAACPGTAADPKAEPGNLCVYASFEASPNASNDGLFLGAGSNGVSRTGGVLVFFAAASGSWAVTG